MISPTLYKRSANAGRYAGCIGPASAAAGCRYCALSCSFIMSGRSWNPRLSYSGRPAAVVSR